MSRLMALPRHNKVASRLPLSAEDGHAADSIGTADFDPYETCDHAATSASMLSHCSGVEVLSRYRLGSNSKDIDCRKLRFSGQAVPQIDGETNVAGPQ